MDKQMIEEMAKLVQGDMCGNIPCEECNYNGKMKILPRYCGTYLIAEKLYNAGYRKIPENAVVMTREEYNNMQFVTEFIGTKQKIGACDFNRVFLQHERKIRKETAEKFARRLKEKLHYDTIPESGITDERNVFESIDEICKEITEGEKEISNETV